MRWRVLVFVALAGLSAPAPVAGVDLSQTCVNPELPFAVRFPDGWWVHPADPSREIDECEFFGPAPFTLTKNQDGVLAGEVVALRAVNGCVGDFRDVVSRRELTVAGKPTTRIEFAASEGGAATPGPAVNLVYWINVQGQECDATTRYVVASTSTDDAATYAQNASVLDAMMETFALGTVPDGAMPERTTSSIPFAGFLLVVITVLLGLDAWRSRRFRSC